MTQNPLISIIMPVYNAEKYLSAAIDSILNQSYASFELLIINDWSSDATKEIAKFYVKKDKRVKFKTHDHIGLVKTRNLLLQDVTKSKYVAVLDADDVAEKNRLEETVSYMELNKDCSVVWVDTKIFDASWERTWSLPFSKKSHEKRKECMRKSPLSHWWSLIRVSDFKQIGFNYDESFLRSHDYELWSRFFLWWYKIEWISWENNAQCYHRIYWGTQGKRKFLKTTLKNTMRVQYRMLKWWFIPSLKDICYYIAECIFYCLPSNLVFWLFKKSRWIKK